MQDIEVYLALALSAFCLAAAVACFFRRQVALRVLAAVAFVGVFPSDYWFHVRPLFHQWEQYHLFMTAKYFPEVGYENLYACAHQADFENAPERWASPQWVRDLRTNRLFHSDGLVGQCVSWMGDGRWEEFRRDIAYFSARTEELRPGRWLQTFTDHGVNVTPFWAGVYHPLVADVPANAVNTSLLSAADFAFLLAALFLVFRGWGLDGLTLVILFISLNEASRAGWLVGSLFRFEWFFLLVLGAYALKKGRAGLAFVAASLSVFFRPVAVLAPIAGALPLWREGRRRRLSLLAAGLIGIGAVISSGSLYAFFRRAVVYQNSFLTNSVGLLPPFIASSSSYLRTRGNELVQRHSYDGLEERQVNEDLYHDILRENRERALPYLAIGAGILILLAAVSLWRMEPLSSYGFVSALSFLLVSPPSYYSLVLALLFLLPEVPVLYLTAVFVALGVMKLIPLEFGQTAVAYAWMSGVMLAMVVSLNLWYLARYGKER